MKYISEEEKRSLRTWAEISEQALLNNYEVVKQSAPGKKIMCVIKGNAHGHDAVLLGKILDREGTDAFGVAALSEALELRRAGITKPILILGWTSPEDIRVLIENDLTQSVFSTSYAESMQAAAEKEKAALKVHIKVDTGMSRTGFFAQKDPAEAAAEIQKVFAMSALCVTGIFTHYAAADMPEKDEYTAWQSSNFCKTIKALEAAGTDLSGVTVHSSNSAGILYHSDFHFDMVRAGVMLYGFSPRGIPGEPAELAPVLALKSRVVMVKDIEAGTKVSYGCTYTADKTIRIATVCAGYADSYPRRLSNSGAYAVVRGQKCRQIGRVCMDMCMFDVTGIDVQEGDEIILYGNGGMSLDEVAAMTNSINCEITSLLTNRVRRVLVP